MLCPVDLTAALLLALIYPLLCDKHKAQVRRGFRAARERAKLFGQRITYAFSKFPDHS